MNNLHNTINFGNNTVDLLNIENNVVTELMSIPFPSWADKKAMAEAVKAVAISKGLY